ncbi:hypothetical protein FQN57_006622 [Myotisia sp. PD_48]|nr:hypothetical protein FQN57_006622 [Myotisia sp. PD_48]
MSSSIGSRTAWSSVVTINGKEYSARYFYDGDYLYNAYEDASEVAYKKLTSENQPPTAFPGQLYAQNPQQGTTN